MAGLSADVRNLDALQRKLEQLPRAVRAGSEQAVTTETEELADTMRDAAPVDTGELVGSVETRVEGQHGTVVATARHAWPVQSGTSTTPAQPYADAAAEQARETFPQRIKDDVKSELPT